MKILLPILAVAMLTLASCASTPSMSDNERLALYRAHAGAPVSSLRYFGRFNSWSDIGDRALAIWTKPNEAWLLELSGPCNGLEFTPVIGLTSQTGQVYARFDSVLVRNGGVADFPCRIETIRPIDVKAIRQAERLARTQASGGT
ncbi:MAG TPA: DUF6491 family protein [Luteimonas sp.]|nr:DUF6491 family protein [Luteimonas sp.]